MTKRYAGIGSRSTPPEMILMMEKLGEYLALRGWILHSGGAYGADMAFERGADLSLGEKRIFLPWMRFNGNTSKRYVIPPEAFDIAATVHPAWDKLTSTVKSFHARNIQQVLGEDLCTPVDMVICWTEKGAEVGGTATAIRLAKRQKIPVFNLAFDTDCETLYDLLKADVL